MTQKKFLEKISVLPVSTFFKKLKEEDGWIDDSKYDPISSKKDVDLVSTYLVNEWINGRVIGGSCFVGEGHQPQAIPGEKRTDFESLELVLELVCPNITFLQFQSLCREVVVESARIDADYYGDSTSYAQEVIKLIDLYDALKERKLI